MCKVQPYQFLAALPAVLALTGFVVFQIMRRNKSGDDVTLRIVERLRKDAPGAIADKQSLGPDQIERVLRGNQTLQRLVGKQDFLLLQQALRQQFIASLVAYGLAVVLCAASVFLFLRHESAAKQLVLSDVTISDADNQAKGLLVDLDTLDVKWSANGAPEDFTAYLENMQTAVRTDPIKCHSVEDKISFPRDDYKALLVNRSLGQTNRIRAVLQTNEGTFTSMPVELAVGLTVMTIVDSQGLLTVAAMIDNSRIEFYDFNAKIVIPARKSERDPFSIGPSIPYYFKSVRVPRPSELDWDYAKGVYFSPSDPRLVRFAWLIDSSVK